MKCTLCDKMAGYICKFCGRMVCEEHRHFKPYIMAAYDEDSDRPKVLVVEDSTWCGKCHPVSTPLTIPELE